MQLRINNLVRDLPELNRWLKWASNSIDQLKSSTMKTERFRQLFRTDDGIDSVLPAYENQKLGADGTDPWTLTGDNLDISGSVTVSGTLEAGTLTEGGNAVPNSTNHLGFFAATTSAQLAGVISDETGSGALAFATSPTITTPVIATHADFGATGIRVAGSSGVLSFTDAGGGSPRLLVGNTSAVTFTSSVSPTLQVLGTSAATASGGVARFSNDANPVRISGLKSRGASIGTHGVLSNNDGILTILAEGSDGDSYGSAAQIEFEADGTWGDGDTPGRIQFLTTADGTASPALAFQVRESGNLQLEKLISSYRALATVSGGVPAERATVDLTAQGAAITATTAYTTDAGTAGPGMYRVSFVAKVTQAATTSSVLGGTSGFQVLYTDQNDSVVVTTPAGHVYNSDTATLALNTTQAVYSGVIVINAKAGTAIQYAIDYTSVGGTPMQYNLHVKVEAL